jgi:hypothetical protein
MTYLKLSALSFALALAVPGLAGAKDADGCVKVDSTWTLTTFDCVLDGDFSVCLGGPLKGSFKSSNWTYHELGLDAFPDGSGAKVSWGTDTMETHTGIIYLSDRVLVDPANLMFAALLSVEGGTGEWEGATGIIAVHGTGDTATLNGQICKQ